MSEPVVTPRRRLSGRRTLLACAVIGAGLMLAVHLFGWRLTLYAAAAVGGVMALLTLLRFYPHLRRHFAPFGRRVRRQRTARRERRSTSRMARRSGSAGRRAGLGTGRRGGGGPSRRGLLGRGSRRGSMGGAGAGRRRVGKGLGGAARRRPATTATGRRRAGLLPGSRRRAAARAARRAGTGATGRRVSRMPRWVPGARRRAARAAARNGSARRAPAGRRPAGRNSRKVPRRWSPRRLTPAGRKAYRGSARRPAGNPPAGTRRPRRSAPSRWVRARRAAGRRALALVPKRVRRSKAGQRVGQAVATSRAKRMVRQRRPSRMRRAWRWLFRRQQQAPQARQQRRPHPLAPVSPVVPDKPKAATAPQPQPGKPQQRPHIRLAASNGRTIHPTGGASMSDNTGSVIEAFQEHIGKWQPANGHELDAYAQGLPELMRQGGQAIIDSAEGMTDQHIHPAVIEMFKELGQSLIGLGDTADDAYQTHAREHELWLSD